MKTKKFIIVVSVFSALLVLLAITKCGNASRVETKEIEPTEDENFKNGKALFRSGDYDAAIGKFNLIFDSPQYGDSARILIDSIKGIQKSDRNRKSIEDSNSTLEQVNSFDGTSYFSSITSIVSGADKLDNFESLGNYYQKSEINEVASNGKRISNQVSSLKVKWMPIFRKEATKQFDSNLWRRDIDVSCFGNGCKTLQYVGGFFATNANIADFHETMVSIFRELGFTRVQYRWYEGSEYTYYTIN